MGVGGWVGGVFLGEFFHICVHYDILYYKHATHTRSSVHVPLFAFTVDFIFTHQTQNTKIVLLCD